MQFTPQQVHLIQHLRDWFHGGAFGCYVVGPSGSGKTVAAEAWKQELHQTVPRAVSPSVFWSTIDDVEPEVSFTHALDPQARNLYHALDSLTEHGANNAVILIHDLEVALQTPATRSRFESLLTRLYQYPQQPAINDRTIRVLGTTTRELPNDGVCSAYFGEPLHLDLPAWSFINNAFGFNIEIEVINHLLPEVFGGIPDLRQATRPSFIAIKLLQELGIQDQNEILTVVMDALQPHANLLAEYLNRINGDLPNIVRDDLIKRFRFLFLQGIHSSLYSRLLTRPTAVSPDCQQTMKRLLVWASVDPGFEMFHMSPWIEDFQRHSDQLQAAYAFFAPEDGNQGPTRPRLAHSTVLSLYGSDWLNDQRASLHDEAYRHLNALREGNHAILCRRAIAAQRHKLRSTPQRTWECLNELDTAILALAGTASHEAAYALRDFVAPWSGNNATISRSTMYQWYQSPRYVNAMQLDDTVLRDTGKVMYLEAAYQALDEWPEASAGIFPLLSSYFDATAPGPHHPDNNEVLNDLKLMVASMASTMAYEGYGPEDGFCWVNADNPARRCYNICLAALRSVVERPDDASHMALRRNVTTNLFVSGMKLFPAKLPEEVPTRAAFIGKLNDLIQQQDVRGWIRMPIEGLWTQDYARYRLIRARWLWLRGKRSRAIRELEVVCANQNPGRQDQPSQEWCYARVQLSYFRLYNLNEGDEVTIAMVNGEYEAHQLCLRTTDYWAYLQCKVVQLWWAYTNKEYAGLIRRPKFYQAQDESLECALRTTAHLFNMDRATKVVCLMGVAFLRSKREQGNFHDVWMQETDGHGNEPQALLAGDRLYSSMFRAIAEPDNVVATDLFQMWFGSAWVNHGYFAPIMPGMMILRGVPIDYRPRVGRQLME